jgi:hypothetical protein
MRQFAGMALLVLGGVVVLVGSSEPVGAQGNVGLVQDNGASSWTTSGAGPSIGNAEGAYTGWSADLMLSGLNTAGALSAARDIQCRGCQVQGNVSAGRDIRLEASPQVGSIAAGRDVSLTDTQVRGSVSAGHGVTLAKCQVRGSLSTGNQAELRDSAVDGSLALGGARLNLDASTVAQDVYFQGTHSPVSQVGISSGGSLIRHQDGSSFVRVGPRSLSRMNGYTVQGAAGQTTVITPEQSIYVNGRKVSGDGPKTYDEYRGDEPDAPAVEGPGWSSQSNSPTAANTSGAARTASNRQPAVNWLELSHNSRINGQVVFESGYGKVLLHPGSRVDGKVINGTVEHLPD